jgi:murein DD-endopeptidase MepM/ murein hydrolase activator NlpD
MAGLSSLSIIQDFIPLNRRNRPGTRIKPTSITIHNTDNPAAGADAAAHARFAKAGAANPPVRSWHYTVDDKAIYQHLPINEMGLHAFAAANSSSIGIEICMHKGMDSDKAYANAARLTAALMHDLRLSGAAVLKQHYDWTKKNCPSVLRGKSGGWASFVKAVLAQYAAPESSLEAAPSAARTDMRAAAAGAAMHPGLETAATAQAQPVPAGQPVAFARSSAEVRYWPVITKHSQALLVSALLTTGRAQGRPGRQFNADRLGGRRRHIGLDLFCFDGDEVVAIEDGKIVNFYAFYETRAGEMSYALLVAHDGYVANYGEVKENSLRAYGLSIGSSVKAGQKIGRVSSTDMIHFETWTSGTRRSSRWMTGGARPRALLNPTQLLLDLAATAIRLDVSGMAMAVETEAALPQTARAATARGRGKRKNVRTERALEMPVVAASPLYPQPSSSDWHNRYDGQEWRYDHRGVYLKSFGGGAVPLSWEGHLSTMRRIHELMGNHVLAMSLKHKINPALIMMTIATETHFRANAGFTGPGTFRWEPSPTNDDIKPKFKGSYSAGPMQTLAVTMRELIVNHGKTYGLSYVPLKVAPAIRSKPAKAPAKHPLYEYVANIELGTAEIRMNKSKTGDDPILVAAAYNAGSLKPSSANDWRIASHGDHLNRSAKWYGDACAFLTQIGVF